MDARFVGVGSSRVLVARPRHHAFGILITDVLIAAHVAKASGTRLLLLAERQAPDSPLLRLQCSGVRRVDRRSLVGRLIAMTWPLWMWAADLRYTWSNRRNATIDAALGVFRSPAAARFQRIVIVTSAFVYKLPLLPVTMWNAMLKRLRFDTRADSRWGRFINGLLLPRWLRRSMRDEITSRTRRFELWLDASRVPPPPGRTVFQGYDVRELSVRAPLEARLSPADEASGRQLLASAGLAAGERFVVLHVRESSSKQAMGGADRSKDTSRNADMASFLPAIDEIVRRGFRVVRIGDPSMPPLVREGVIDLAAGAVSDVVAQLYAIEHCHFFIAADAGPYLLSWLFGVPCLCVNVTNLLGVFPLRESDRYLVKRVRELPSGRMVPVGEMLTESFIYSMKRRLYKAGTLEYVDNTAEEIVAAVKEMFRAVDGTATPETPAQAEYRRLVAAAREGQLSRAKTYAKTASDVVFLGDGRVVADFAERHMATPLVNHAP